MKADISTKTPIWLAVKIVAPKVGGATLANSSMLVADGQLAGMPSVLFNAVDAGGQALLRIAGVEQDAGVVEANDKAAFLTAARTRQWDRERSVWTLV